MKNYFEYFPVGKKEEPWGVRCTAIGRWKNAPSEPYPSQAAAHPQDHDFTWQRGRILHDLQLVYIREGKGSVEYKNHGKHRVMADTLFLVLPGVWHRYRPDPDTGWTEHWIELQGSLIKNILLQNAALLRCPVFSVHKTPELLELFLKSHQLVDMRPWNFEQQIGLSGLEILLLALRSSLPSKTHDGKTSSTELEVRKLHARLAEHSDEPIKLRTLLENSPLSEVHFRRLFKKRTGLSPKQYLLQIRHRKATDLLQQTTLTLAQIAEQLGYDTAYHLSQDFKHRMGIAPAYWRQSHKQE